MSDDLDRWAEDDLVRALRAPGTPGELAGEERYVAAFRAARTSRAPGGAVTPLRRLGRRLGTGGTAVVVAVGLSGGVAAAALTRTLPEPVQRAVHEVVGAPAPEPEVGPEAEPEGGRTPEVRPTTPGSTPTSEPSTPSADPTPSRTPSRSPSTKPTPSAQPTPTPSPTPSATPTTEPTPLPPPAPVPAAVAVAGSSHRADPGASVTLSGTVTAADGTPVAGQPVRLQVRGPQRWRHVADATADATGAVTFSTPPAATTARYRLVGGARVRSDVWRVVLVPTVTASSTPAGDRVSIATAVTGGQARDRVVLLRQGPQRLLFPGRGRLDAGGRATVEVPARRKPATYVVRLLRTPAHARAVTRLTVTPARPDSVSVTAPTHEVGPGATTTVSGVVRAADGTPLAGREVTLQRRGPDRWLAAGTATTDATGSVAIATPVADHTTVYRLVSGGVASERWKVVLVPTVQVTVTAGDPADLAVTTQGGRAGDTVSLLRRVEGRLVPVLRATLAADGTAHFSVTPGKRVTRYVVRLLRTPVHGAARAPVEVPASP